MSDKQDYFQDALQDFVKNFAWGGTIEHLLDNGYTIDRMLKEKRIVMPREQIIEMCEKINKQRIAEHKEPFDIR